MIGLRVVSSVFLSAGLAVGCASAASPAGTIAPSAVPTAVPSAAVSPTDAASPTPADTIATLRSGQHPLEAGTYRLELSELALSAAELPPIRITVPDGWNNLDGWALHRDSSGEVAVAVTFWDVAQVYRHPCRWSGTLFDPGPTVDDLADALVDVPMRSATQPIDVTLGGYAGKYLEWSVPADIEMDEQGNFADCDSAGGLRDFKSWTGKGWASNRYHQGPGQVDRLWILDIDGTRLVIDAFYMPSATMEEREELQDVVESIRFE